jgi:Bacterial SH3 domain
MKNSFVSLAIFWLLAGFAGIGDARADGLGSPASFFEEAMAEFDEGQQLLSSDADRARKLFRDAATKLSSIAAGGVENGYLEYNLGNCYLQAGDIGRAVLHYKRAKRLIPTDALLTSNLAVARSRCVTQVRRSARSEVLETIFFVHHQLALRHRVALAVVAYLLIWAFLLVRNRWPHRWTAVGATVCSLVAVSLAVSVTVSFLSDRNEPEGVVLGSDVTVYKGPGTSYQRLLEQPLQPGVEFTLRERRGDWWRVELADGNAGWIPLRIAELVPRDEKANVAFLSGA